VVDFFHFKEWLIENKCEDVHIYWQMLQMWAFFVAWAAVLPFSEFKKFHCHDESTQLYACPGKCLKSFLPIEVRRDLMIVSLEFTNE